MNRLAFSAALLLAACGGGGGSGDSADGEALVLGSREAPVSMGADAGPYTDGISLIVASVIQDATQIVLDENRFNDPPAPGNVFFLATVRVVYSGAGTYSYDPEFDLRATGSRGKAYATFRESCGVIPDDCDNLTLFSGGSATCNLCWEIGAEEIGSMLMFRASGELMEQTGEPFFFSLVPPA